MYLVYMIIWWKKTNLRFIKLIFAILLSFITKLDTEKVICASLDNVPCLIRPTLIDLSFDELSGYLLAVNLGKCSGRCNTLYDISLW